MAGSVNHNQFPAYYDQLAGAFSFNPGAAGAAVPVQPPAVVTPINPCDAARADWQVLQTTNSTGALEQFAQQHQSCPIYVAAAQDRLASLRAAQPAPQPVQPAPVIAGGASLCERLWYERNLIYHNRGYCFQTSRAKAVFDTSQCSTRAPSLTAAELSEVERLKAAEKANGC
ncbi:MAG: YARHG domain-containing protein [Pseudomonadota bacterium]